MCVGGSLHLVIGLVGSTTHTELQTGALAFTLAVYSSYTRGSEFDLKTGVGFGTGTGIE